MIINRFFGGISNKTLPGFTYTGTYSVVDDGDAGWRIKFLTSGTLTLSSPRIIDVFLVGGGASGNAGSNLYVEQLSCGGGGGGAGYTKTYKSVTTQANKSYSIVIGAGGASVSAKDNGSPTKGKSGGSTKAFGYTAAGGTAYWPASNYLANGGGSGGSGGANGGQEWADEYDKPTAAGYNGSNAVGGSAAHGAGQGETTREFGEASGKLYAGGGGGGGVNYNGSTYSGTAGGSGGGGRGASHNTTAGDGTANTGGGGGGGFVSWQPAQRRRASGDGGSGIVVIRNHRS